MKIYITDRNRDGAAIWFEPAKEPGLFTIHSNKDYVIKYACCSYDKVSDDSSDYDFEHTYENKTIRGKYKSFDPSGGPFLEVGDTFGDLKLTRIFEKDNMFYFKLERLYNF